MSTNAHKMKNVQQQTLGFEATIVKGDFGAAGGAAAKLMVGQRVCCASWRQKI